MVSSAYYNYVSKTQELHNEHHSINPYVPSYEDIKDLAIYRLNRLLGFVLIASIVTALFSYYFVTMKESQIIKIHKQTNELTFENIDLENSVDYTKSFYSINQKATELSSLKKPEQVMVVNSKPSKSYTEPYKSDIDQIVTGY